MMKHKFEIGNSIMQHGGRRQYDIIGITQETEMYELRDSAGEVYYIDIKYADEHYSAIGK